MKMKRSRSIQFFIFGFLYLVAMMLSVPAKAGIIGSPVFHNGHNYYLLDAKPWISQEAEAVALGGHLVTINDAAENIWIWDTFGNTGSGLFFGFNDAAIEGTFVWSSGEPVTFTNWRSGEPNNCCGGESFGELANDYQWNDVGQFHQWQAVAEVVPEPSTILLMGSGLAYIMAYRRKKNI